MYLRRTTVRAIVLAMAPVPGVGDLVTRASPNVFPIPFLMFMQPTIAPP